MKKVFLVAALALFGFSVSAQEGFKVGANLGLPVGDFSELYSFNVGLDVAYMFEVSDNFDAGIASGFINTFGKTQTIAGFEIDAADAQFIPIAAAGRFKASDEFSVGADLGYGIEVSGGGGGFYYRPIVGYNLSEKTEINLSYSGISFNGGTWSAVNVGVLFSL